MNQEVESIPERPEWPPYTDVGIEWDREAWAYIQHQEAVERNLRESCEILKRMDSEKNAQIQHLEGEIGTLKEHLRRADKNIETKENYIQELRGEI